MSHADSIEVFDPETWLESLIVPAGILVGLSGAYYIFAELPLEEEAALFTCTVFAIVVTLLAFGLRKCLDAHYEVDYKIELVRYRRRFLGQGLRRQICRFDEIAGVFLTSRYRTTNRRSWREYGLSLKLQNGRSVGLLHPSEESYQAVEGKGMALAQRLGVPLWCNGLCTDVKFTQAPDGLQISYQPTMVDRDVNSLTGWAKWLVVSILFLLSAPFVFLLIFALAKGLLGR